MNTVRLTAETGAFDWISDTYDDDLPYWREYGARDQLVIPYTRRANDMRLPRRRATSMGNSSRPICATVSTLYAEGGRMFSIRTAQPADRAARQGGGAEAPSTCHGP